MTRGARWALLLVVAALAASTAPGCKGQRRPTPPRADHDPLAVLGGADSAPTLEDLVGSYPLGALRRRADLLAVTDDYSVFLLQSREGVPQHFRRAHRERTCVLRGAGTCYIEDRSYPAVEGSSFRIESGMRHGIASDTDGVLTALLIFEPALASMDEDWVQVGDASPTR